MGVMPFLATCHTCKLLYRLMFFVSISVANKVLSLSLITRARPMPCVKSVNLDVPDLGPIKVFTAHTLRYVVTLTSDPLILNTVVYRMRCDQILAKPNNPLLSYSDLKIEN